MIEKSFKISGPDNEIISHELPVRHHEGQVEAFKNKIHVRLFLGTTFIDRLATATRLFDIGLYKNCKSSASEDCRNR